jgi:hypothetical protein
VRKDGDPVENPLLIENQEEIPEDQDPFPSITAYNESFGTCFRGELLSVGGEVIGADGDVPEFYLLWKSPKFVGETRGDASKKKLRLTGKTVCVAKKQTSSLQKSMMIFDSVVQVPLGTLNRKGLNVTFFFVFCYFFLFYLYNLLMYFLWFSHVLKRPSGNFHLLILQASAKPII